MTTRFVPTMPDDFEDGAAFVRPGMRPPTKAEMDAEIAEDVECYYAQVDEMMDEIVRQLVEEVPVAEQNGNGGTGDPEEVSKSLPGCQQPHSVVTKSADIGSNEISARKLRSNRRRSPSADARLIEGKRASEISFSSRSQPAKNTASKVPSPVLPTGIVITSPTITRTPIPINETSGLIEADEAEDVGEEANRKPHAISASGVARPAAAKAASASCVSRPAVGKAAVSITPTKAPLIPWWVKKIAVSRYEDEDGVIHENPSIHRTGAPAWRDLCDEARLDFYQDAGLEIAAALPNHGLCHVIINLSHEVEKQAVAKPNSLEWCKLRIAGAVAASGLPCSMVMVSEEAPVRNRAEEERRHDLGLHPTRRFHIHALAVLPRSPRAYQTLRDALRKKGAVGSWDAAARGKQIMIRPGHMRATADYLAKDLDLGSRRKRQVDVKGNKRFRNYRGKSITVTNDMRDAAIRIYSDWRTRRC